MRPLATIAELGQSLERRLIVVQRQATDENPSPFVLGVLLLLGGRQRQCSDATIGDHAGENDRQRGGG